MRKLTIIILFLLVFSCSPSFTIQYAKDQFDNYEVYFTRWNTIKINDNFLWSKSVEINFQVFIKIPIVQYNIITIYEGDDWLFIEEGESLILLVDGERMAFTGEGSSGHRNVFGGRVSEMAFYDITKEQLRKLAKANEIKVKIIGRYPIRGIFTEQNIKNLRKFYFEFAQKF